jgi:cytidine deaminase
MSTTREPRKLNLRDYTNKDIGRITRSLLGCANTAREYALENKELFLGISGFPVGAALLPKCKEEFQIPGNIISDHNFEGPELPYREISLSNLGKDYSGLKEKIGHAEERAINKMQLKNIKPHYVAVVLEGNSAFPCGDCRQFIKSGSDENAIIFAADSSKLGKADGSNLCNLDYEIPYASIEELLPDMTHSKIEIVEEQFSDLVRESRSKLNDTYDCMIMTSEGFFMGSEKRRSYFSGGINSLADAICKADINLREKRLEAVVFLDERSVNGINRQWVLDYGTSDTPVIALSGKKKILANTIEQLLPYAPKLGYEE